MVRPSVKRLIVLAGAIAFAALAAAPSPRSVSVRSPISPRAGLPHPGSTIDRMASILLWLIL